MKKVLTLAFLITDTEICLAMKKRGFGEGNWNGYGGKLEGDETVTEAAVREIEEESGVRVEETNLEQVALLNFIFEDGTHLETHTFLIRAWEGEPQETEEMRPMWYRHNALPYESMWADDPHWLPKVLKGEKLHGTVWFDESGRNIKDMQWNVVQKFNEVSE